jgi:hypothetical protein
VFAVGEVVNDQMKTAVALAECSECNKDWKVIITIIIQVISEIG